MQSYQIHLPLDASPGHCLATFGTIYAAFGVEVGTRVNAGLTEKIGNDWFAQLESIREAKAKIKGKGFKPAYSRYDFSWLANEVYYNTNSPIRGYLPQGQYDFYSSLHEMVEFRNRWFHDADFHNIKELEKSVKLAVYLAEKCELESLGQIRLAYERVLSIKNGINISATVEPNNQSNSASTDLSEVTGTRQRAVGALWLGEPGARKLNLRQSGAIIDEGLKSNVLNELTVGQSSLYLGLWQRIVKHGWLYVDQLGQVGAYVNGEFRCVGLWGESAQELQEDPFLKFRLPQAYLVRDQEILDRVSGQVLDESKIGPVTKSTLARARDYLENDEVVRVTWDGEMIAFTSDGPTYLGEIEPSDWFTGHFLTLDL